MPHPIEVIYTPYYKIILAALTRRLPFAYIKYIQTTGIKYDETTIENIIKDFKQCVEFNSEAIFIATSARINIYLNDFSVMPRGTIDEFKTIFFLAQTISKFLERDGLDTASKVNLTTMIWLLDFRLATLNASRKTLSTNAIKMINKGALFVKTGEIGLYLTYKCLYNQAKDNIA